MENLLFLSHRLPYPPDKGDKIRSFELLRHLTKRYHVHLGCFVDDPADREHIGTVEQMCASSWIGELHPLQGKLRSAGALVSGKSLSFGYFSDKRLQAWLKDLRSRHRMAVEIAYSSPMAAYLDRQSGAMRIADFVDLDSEKWLQYAARHNPVKRWLYTLEAHRLARAEVSLTRDHDAIVLCAQREAADLCARSGARADRVFVVGNGVDLEYFDGSKSLEAPPLDPKRPLIVFTGVMDYYANVDGVLWFAEEIFPGLRNAVPDVQFAIVGARPAPAVQRLGQRPGITVTGRVPDVRPWLLAASAAIVPLRIARGVQNKVLEAMAMSLPVVATGAALAGIEAETGRDLLRADDADEITAALISVLTDRERNTRLRKRARAVVEQSYAWPKRLAVLDGLIKSCVEQRMSAVGESS
jgi:sugar transferase (PEP-CTERM/EpsH1 system associated)